MHRHQLNQRRRKSMRSVTTAIVALSALLIVPTYSSHADSSHAEESGGASRNSSMMGPGSMMRGMDSHRMMGGRGDRAGGMMQGCRGMMGGGAGRPNEQWRGR